MAEMADIGAFVVGIWLYHQFRTKGQSQCSSCVELRVTQYIVLTRWTVAKIT